MDLKIGKRYWFRDREFVYNGLYARNDNKCNSNAILIRKNGDEWSINKNDIKQSLSELTENMNTKYFRIIDN